ncbi:DUF4233 domain-containing protein [Cutibacterium avidum]|nr:DUF4233 domain-containing protein [Cutibacterium avidum]MBS5745063.1 DUF4233 domain-containing protein [Propionibacterium sp.]AOG27645.1 hypothetical protein BFS79_02860 [Cutibacterium avidum]MBS6330753.1 DUF4233 domain-containing protein [Propionibacterium sp.]MCO6672546.1 DUF4233 domain-containing protein [Cutibacterium avidum]MCO6674871.1 DUF4233 domain-containing protein [Cutibacterium avidum]
MTMAAQPGIARGSFLTLPAGNPMTKVVVSFLAFEVIVFGLTIPGMILVSGISVAMSVVLGCIGMVASILCAVGVPRTWGYLLAWALQIFGILLGLATPMMYAVGIVFAAIWVSIIVLGRRIDGNPEVR